MQLKHFYTSLVMIYIFKSNTIWYNINKLSFMTAWNFRDKFTFNYRKFVFQFMPKTFKTLFNLLNDFFQPKIKKHINCKQLSKQSVPDFTPIPPRFTVVLNNCQSCFFESRYLHAKFTVKTCLLHLCCIISITDPICERNRVRVFPLRHRAVIAMNK